MDKEKVKEALQTIEKALEDEEFQKWIEENQEELEFQYEDYRTNCYESLEEPDSFYTWALWQYAFEDQTEDSSKTKRPNAEGLKQTFIEDLEHIKTLLENYNEGKGKLAEIWDFINARLEVYKLED